MYSKKLIVGLSLLFCFLTAAAQDVIVKSDGSQLAGKVIEVTESVVKYKKVDNLNGPLYSISTDNILRINYENGDSDVFVDEDETAPATVLSGKTGKVSDTDLLKLHVLGDNPYIVPNRIRLWGFIGGGALFVSGAAFLASISISQSAHPTEFFAGVGLAAAGVATMTTCYFVAKHKRNAINKNYLSSAPIYRHNVFDIDGKSLSIGMDYIVDNNHTRTMGLGLTYNF
ncbi:MAG: hypothetical protein K2L93_03880 [Muribaculaceae bacterium]|nr:hypothetical protein [Muribaculaceae bacterium]